jgi:hypothetical protein
MMEFSLIRQVELTRKIISENWDITSLHTVTLEEWQSQNGVAKEKTDESYDGFCGDLGLHKTNTPPEDKPRSNDIIKYEGTLLRLGDVVAEGEFTTINIMDGKTNVIVGSDEIMKNFYPKTGKDGRNLWLPRNDK